MNVFLFTVLLSIDYLYSGYKPLTRAFEGFFSVCLNLSFRGRQSTVSMVFHAL